MCLVCGKSRHVEDIGWMDRHVFRHVEDKGWVDQHVSRHVESRMRLGRHVAHEVARGGLQVGLERTCKTLERPPSSSIRGKPLHGLHTPF